MGAKVGKIFSAKKEQRLLIQGLDAAGKTTVLYRLKLGEVVTTIPTIGFNVETIEYKNVSIVAWDVGGRDKIRPLWRHYYQNTSALIYVVDSNDRERLEQAGDELLRVCLEDELRGIPVLVFANKQDLPGAASVGEITEALGLNTLRGRPWYIQACTATTGDGLYQGLDWLTKALKGNKDPPPEASTSDKVDALKKPFVLAFGHKTGSRIFDAFKHSILCASCAMQ